MSMDAASPQRSQIAFQTTPSRRAWFKSEHDGTRNREQRAQTVSRLEECDECWGPLKFERSEAVCRVCGLVHLEEVVWETSLEIEARRRQFDHNSEDGSGTLEYDHVVAVEDSAASTFFDGTKLDSNKYPLDAYNDGRDPHSVAGGEKYKLNRERRFLEQRAEACATAAGLTGEAVREVVRLVNLINSGAFTSYGPEREGGGQDAHIAAAIAYVGNKGITDMGDRMESREAFKSVVDDIGIDRDRLHGAVSQLHKQLRDQRG